MAGSHLRGAEHARAELFEGACCVLTPAAGCDPGARARLRAFWEALGARVVERDPVAHDIEVAWMSHLPHVLSFAFAECLENAPDSAAEVAGSGFRDFTRIALSDAELWGDIFSANRKALAVPIEAFGEALKRLAVAIEEADTGAQERILESARERLAAVAAASAPGRGRDTE
jgi:prephenate dehydrogenase